MQKFKHSILALFFSFSLYSQPDLEGVWQGILIKDGASIENALLIYAEFKSNEGTLSGKIRNEILGSDNYAVKKAKGKMDKKNISFEEFVIEKKKSSGGMNWCTVEGTLHYSDTSGYLEGRFKSKTCRAYAGKIILFRSTASFSSTEGVMLAQSWLKTFASDYKKGYYSPEIREKERNSFVFEPIYFDYDKATIKPEYENYLNKIIRVVNGHSDLRIKVTGNTDHDGSDEYNLELSKKRAQALIDYLTQHGMDKEKIIIDFKGENEPVDSNETPEGKQRNRRVDIRFI